MINPAVEWHADTGLSAAELEQFQHDGYLILRGFTAADTAESLRLIAQQHLKNEIAPLEYEAELHYPGAPTSLAAEGGHTVRRLLQAQGRHPDFTQWLNQPALLTRLHQLLGPEVFMPLAHHNCIMTKQPRFSSDTSWHQDIRYWAFQRADLINVWLALGPENADNGCLQLIPGSHRLQFDPSQFEQAQFFREDLAANQALIAQAIHAELEAGDVLIFHCRTLHAATRNFSAHTKYSAVFTFRSGDNHPLPGTRSASLPELQLP